MEFTLVCCSTNVLVDKVENVEVERIQLLIDVVWEELSECQLKDEFPRFAKRDYSVLGRWVDREGVGPNQDNDPPGSENK